MEPEQTAGGGRELRVGMLPGLACVLYRMEILMAIYALRVIKGQSNMVFTARRKCPLLNAR